MKEKYKKILKDLTFGDSDLRLLLEEKGLYGAVVKAVEKQIPKKPTEEQDFILCSIDFFCPNCEALVGEERDELLWLYNNCHKCGQAIERSNNGIKKRFDGEE